jgi:hypothetical protein
MRVRPGSQPSAEHPARWHRFSAPTTSQVHGRSHPPRRQPAPAPDGSIAGHGTEITLGIAKAGPSIGNRCPS